MSDYRTPRPLAVFFVLCVVGLAIWVGLGWYTSQAEDVEVYIQKISDGETVKLDMGELQSSDSAEFAFIVRWKAGVKSNNGENTVLIKRETYSAWTNATVTAFAEKGTPIDAAEEMFTPEDDPANEVAVRTEVLDGERFRVSSASGSFPSESQIVLRLRFDSGPGFIARVFT
jgi:hypothetical protein